MLAISQTVCVVLRVKPRLPQCCFQINGDGHLAIISLNAKNSNLECPQRKCRRTSVERIFVSLSIHSAQKSWQVPYQMRCRERADARNAALFNRRAALKLARQAVRNDERETVSRMPGSWSDQAQSRVGTIPLFCFGFGTVCLKCKFRGRHSTS